ncbi:MAG: sugar ABC transporter permease [Lachnospiraceae bacterium]|nr:sugar ABC transporter permease [Lachnospiraceae bacterium]
MKKQKKLAGLQKRKAIAGYIFILPFIIGFLAFLVKPLFQSLYMSFCEVQLSGKGITNVFLGWGNYNEALTVDVNYTRFVTETFTKMCINALAIMVFSFFVALILNQKFKGRALVRAVFFLPVIISSGVVLGIEYNNALLSSVQDVIEKEGAGTGISDAIKNILMTSGVGSRLFEEVFKIIDGIYDVAISSGIQIIIFLSGLQTISSSMYEAAAIEGCTAWESLWKITFPMVSSLFLVNWIYSIIDFSMRSDNSVMSHVSMTMGAYLDYGLASAMAWCYFLVIIVFIGITSLLISKGVYYYE